CEKQAAGAAAKEGASAPGASRGRGSAPDGQLERARVRGVVVERHVCDTRVGCRFLGHWLAAVVVLLKEDAVGCAKEEAQPAALAHEAGEKREAVELVAQDLARRHERLLLERLSVASANPVVREQDAAALGRKLVDGGLK